MKTILTSACMALLLVLSNSCTKEATNVAGNSVTSSTISEATQKIVGRQQVISAPTGDYTYPTSQALLWLPTDYNSASAVKNNKKYPLLICLTGIGECGTNINWLVTKAQNVAKQIADGWNGAVKPVAGGDSTRFIMFTPQCPVKWGWSAPHIKNMLAYLKAKYRVDASRVYITGYSAGGWGLWSCMTDDTSLCKQFAAIGPVSTASADHPDQIPNVDKYGIACWNICGTADAFYQNAVNYTNIINNNKPRIKAKLTGLAGVGHSAWEQAYDPKWKVNGINFYQWLIQYHK